jgi:hypothetical protein
MKKIEYLKNISYMPTIIKNRGLWITSDMPYFVNNTIVNDHGKNL